MRTALVLALATSTVVFSTTDAQAAPPRLQRELAEAQRVAIAAGKLVDGMQPTIETEVKGRGEVVTEADRQSSDLIMRELARAFPGDLVISEEAAANRWTRLRLLFARRVWFIDPVDGTKGYAEGRPDYAVQLALVTKRPLTDRGRAVVGVIYEPATGRIEYAAPGTGARRGWVVRDGEIANDQPIRVSTRSSLRHVRVLNTETDRSRADILEMMRALGTDSPHQESRLGAIAVRVARIAAGEADVMMEPMASVRSWDSAPPAAILEAAGGRFTRLDGRRYDYRRVADKGGGQLATNGLVHDRAVQSLRRFAPSRGARPKIGRKR